MDIEDEAVAAVAAAPAPAPAADDDVVGGGVAQWRIRWVDPGGEPFDELCSRWNDVWALSRQPVGAGDDDDEGEETHYEVKANVEARFAAGENNIKVAWIVGQKDICYVVIQKL
jgi:hypothetical protein